MRLRTSVIVIFLVLLSLFLIQNGQDIFVEFLFWDWWIPGSVFILVTVLLSFAVGFLVGRLTLNRRPAKPVSEDKVLPS